MKRIVLPCLPAFPHFPAADDRPAAPKEFRTTGTTGLERSVTRLIHLSPDKVIRLDRDSQVSGILVERGTVWVTETPATRDIVVPQGGYLPLRGGWPVVLQALTEGLVVLR